MHKLCCARLSARLPLAASQAAQCVIKLWGGTIAARAAVQCSAGETVRMSPRLTQEQRSEIKEAFGLADKADKQTPLVRPIPNQ